MRGFILFLALSSCVPTVLAQHLKTDKGDTWTGEIMVVDPAKRILTIHFTDKGGDLEEFTGKFTADYKVFVKDHPDQNVPSLNLGDKVTVYYVAIGQKYPVKDESGKTHDVMATENLIFQAELLPPKKQKK
jgi:hypothetical protein